VLAQQRAEQSRLAADQNRESNDAPLDPASFIQSLPSSLRQQVLADMDDSMVAVLPTDLAAEASVLRREVEERHRRLVQERLFSQGAGLLSGILRHSGTRYHLVLQWFPTGVPWTLRVPLAPAKGSVCGQQNKI